MRLAAVLAMTALLATLSGCAPPRVEQGPSPSYDALAQRYNRRIEGLERMWARAVVAARWRDEQNKPRYEQGNDSKLLVRLPDQVALVIGSAGQIAFWAGADAEKFWLLKLMGDRHAYVGMHENSAGALAAHDLPLQISPRALPMLLGLTPLPLASPGEGEPPVVRAADGGWQTMLPDRRTRLTIDAVTMLPRQIELLDEGGKAAVVALLSGPGRMEVHGRPPGGWPTVMTRIEVRAPRQGFSFTLHLEDMTDAGSPRQEDKAAAFARSFDYQHLVDRAFKIPYERRTVIE